MRRVVSLLAITALAGACAGRTWPTAMSAADPALATRGPITVDVLPVDLAVWTAPGTVSSPEAMRSQLEASILNVALGAMAGRAYGVGALVDWNGNAGDRVVLERSELEATLQALAGYGLAVPAGTPALQPVLPRQLGETTGSDATLYVGGWAYVAEPRESTGEKVAKGIGVALLVLTAVVVVAMIAEGVSDSKKSEGGERKREKGGAAVRDDREEKIASVRDHRSGSGKSPVQVRDHRSSTAARATAGPWLPQTGDSSSSATASTSTAPSGDNHSAGGWQDARDHRTATPRGVRDHRTKLAWSGRVRDHRAGRGDPPLVRDHRGRSYALRGSRRGVIDLALVEGDAWGDDIVLAPRQVEPEPGESRLYLEMTLVDNRNGQVLWHAHQTFPANPRKAGDVERAARVLLASLPAP
jgi:hypothetical protein